MSLTKTDLENHLWTAADIHRGHIDASDYKQYIFPLLFLKRLCDVYDEEIKEALNLSDGDEEYAKLPEQHRFQISEESHWDAIRKATKDVGLKLQNSMRELEKVNERLYGIFGDTTWTNKERLSDQLLISLIEHFSKINLGITNVDQDDLGDAYEYLVKKFADDSGHTAAEFYTNRTVVHLMTQILKPQSGESIYDPTCGTGGMLLNAVMELRKQNKEWRNVKLYGQEINLLTSAIAKMNCFLHDIEDFDIVRDDTLANPGFIEKDKLKTFDIAIANPPYSFKRWNQNKFKEDPYGRNMYGVPPKNNADYAFFQHIIASLDPKKGRGAILYPHGILFRDVEQEIRAKIVEADIIEAVIGLGPNLFYNSPMESCIVIMNQNKKTELKKKILFINAVNEITREQAESRLSEENLNKITCAYSYPAEHCDIAKVVDLKEIIDNKHNLSIALYIRPTSDNCETSVEHSIKEWRNSRVQLKQQIESFFETLKEVGYNV